MSDQTYVTEFWFKTKKDKGFTHRCSATYSIGKLDAKFYRADGTIHQHVAEEAYSTEEATSVLKRSCALVVICKEHQLRMEEIKWA